MRETWYVMTDGTFGDPREIRAGADGRLRHTDGREVAYADHGPRTRGVDVDDLPKKDDRQVSATDDAKSAGKNRQMKSSTGGKGYNTRSSKAD